MKLKNLLRQIKSDNPIRIIADALNLDAKDVYAKLDDDMTNEERFAIERAITGVPAGRILNAKIFYDFPFKVLCGAFEPRNDTEKLIDYVKNNLSPKSILDVCTGTGAILLTLLRLFPDAYGIGTDISQYAIENAELNSRLLGLSNRCNFVKTNFTDGISDGFDLVISNPPYVIGDIDETAKFDPPISLYKPNINPYDAIIQNINLNPGGRVIFEVPAYIAFDYCNLKLIYSEEIAEQVKMVILGDSKLK